MTRPWMLIGCGLVPLLGACSAAKVEEFGAIHGVPQANKDQAYIQCRYQAEQVGDHARMVTAATTPGMVAVGRAEYVAGAAIGHALGSAISQGAAHAKARDQALEACMASAGYMRRPAPAR